jgi:hypothetical protein
MVFDPNTAATAPIGQSFLPGGAAPYGPTVNMQDPIIKKWTGPTGQTDWTRVVLEGGVAPTGIPIDWDFLARQGWRSDALSVVQQAFNSWGLTDPALSEWARNQLVTGASANMIMLDLWQQPAFKQRFSGIFQRIDKGLAPISPAQSLELEREYAQLMSAGGLPAGFYDQPSDFQKFIAEDKSPAEISDRISKAYLQIAYGPPDVLDAMTRIYGVTMGGLAAYVLDTNRALPLLQQQVAAAQIGGSGYNRGYDLSQAELESLAKYGVTRDQAEKGFSNLQSLSPLFDTLPGEGVQAITQAQQLGATFTNDAGAQKVIAQRAESRKAQFQSAGGALYSEKGGTTFQ